MQRLTAGIASVSTLDPFLRELRIERDSHADTARPLHALIDAGFDRLPLPGQGATLERWRMLAALASCDLRLVKLFEGHTDALAIMAETGEGYVPASAQAWDVWAAGPPTARLIAQAALAERIVNEECGTWNLV
jgi:hypothetical protein